QANLFTGGVSLRGCQVAPKSMEKDIFAARSSPAQAWPRMFTVFLPFNRAPDAGKVISDFTGIDSIIHMSSGATSAPGSTGSQGTRYEGASILAPSCTRSRTESRFSHFPETDAGYPEAINRKGYPCAKGISSPFI